MRHEGARADDQVRAMSQKDRMFIPYGASSGIQQIPSLNSTPGDPSPVASCGIVPNLVGAVRSKKESTTGVVAMRNTSGSAGVSRFRLAQMIALSGMIALAACEDVTAPEEAKPATPELRLSQTAADELGSLSSSLDDMTGWSLAALPNAQGKANIVGILNGLKGHLASGRIAVCQQDVADARAILASLSQNEQVELGGVGATLDLIQAALDKASQ